MAIETGEISNQPMCNASCGAVGGYLSPQAQALIDSMLPAKNLGAFTAMVGSPANRGAGHSL